MNGMLEAHQWLNIAGLQGPRGSSGDELLAELRESVPVLREIADRAFAAASVTESHLRRRTLERVGIRATDLIHSLAQLVDL